VSQLCTPTLGLREAQRIKLDRTHDQICIFGFSRSAITARALAGILQKVGLLPAWNLKQLPFAYAVYLKDDHDLTFQHRWFHEYDGLMCTDALEHVHELEGGFGTR